MKHSFNCFTFVRFVSLFFLLSTISHAVIVQDCSIDIPASTPTADFILSDDGTVKHKTTGLIWDRCVWGNIRNKQGCYLDENDDTFISSIAWVDLVSIMEKANLKQHLGYSDWRIPTLDELKTIIEIRCKPAINLTVFPGYINPATFYEDNFNVLSSMRESEERGFFLDFFNGEVSTGDIYYYSPDFSTINDTNFTVRLVRGEQLSPDDKDPSPPSVSKIGFVEGNVYDSCNGKPLEFIDLQISGGRIQQTNEVGSYKLKLESGKYTVSASLNNYTSDSRSISVAVKQTTYVDFPLIPTEGCSSISGPDSYKAVIVAGSGPFIFDQRNHIWTATQELADKAYKSLKQQGFGDNNIYYLSADLNALKHDADGDGHNDIDAAANLENLQDALTSAGGVEDVVVYLIGHGAIDVFSLDRHTQLHADQLKSDLDALQRKITGKLSVIIDACNSGSFLSSLAAENRYIIASTLRDLKAVISGKNGSNSFSYFFWDEVVFSGSFSEAFRKSRQAMSRQIVEANKSQKATLDTNGSGSETPVDYENISRYCFGACNQVASIPPIIESISPQGDLNGQLSATLTLDVIEHNSIEKAWATIQRPDHKEYLPTDGSAIAILPQISLQCKDQVCQGVYDNFNINDEYTLTFYLQDNAGNISVPRSINLRQSGRDNRERSANATYESVTGLLTLKDVEFAGQHYYVELKDPDGYDRFAITYVQALTAGIQKKPATFDGSKIVIPSVFAFGNDYSVNLSAKESLFKVIHVGEPQ